MVCCDTTFIVDLIRKENRAVNKLRELMEREENLFITVITVAELYYGAYKSKNVKEELSKVDEIMRSFLILEMDEISAKEYGSMRASLEKEGINIPERDLLIAAISCSHGERVLLTRNKRDFERIPNITVVVY